MDIHVFSTEDTMRIYQAMESIQVQIAVVNRILSDAAVASVHEPNTEAQTTVRRPPHIGPYTGTSRDDG